MDLENLKKEIEKFLKKRIGKQTFTEIYFFVKPETAKVIQKFTNEIILDKYRKPENFNSYIDLCFGSGNLSIHLLEALKIFENDQAKIKEGKKVVFNDANDIANWQLKEQIEGINFMRKNVFTADFFEDDNITNKIPLNNHIPDGLSQFITYLKYRKEILEEIKGSYTDLTYDNEEITLKEGNRTKAKLFEAEVLQHLFGKISSFKENKEKNSEILNQISEKTKDRVEFLYTPTTFDFITANFLITFSENSEIGSIKLDIYKEVILNVIFEHFLSEKGVFLFVYKTSSENDFGSLKNIFGENADYITVFDVPEMTNEVNFIFKKLNLEQEQNEQNLLSV